MALGLAAAFAECGDAGEELANWGMSRQYCRPSFYLRPRFFDRWCNEAENFAHLRVPDAHAGASSKSRFCSGKHDLGVWDDLAFVGDYQFRAERRAAALFRRRTGLSSWLLWVTIRSIVRYNRCRSATYTYFPALLALIAPIRPDGGIG
jgi:hypothetical protein